MTTRKKKADAWNRVHRPVSVSRAERAAWLRGSTMIGSSRPGPVKDFDARERRERARERARKPLPTGSHEWESERTDRPSDPL